jgi:outer membrane murein-binding lipoprotein Lpp
MKSIIKIVLGAVLSTLIVSGCAVPDTEGTAADRAAEDRKDRNAKEKNGGKNQKAEKAEPEMTAGQKNALASAEQYLDYSAFSKPGLVKQLKFEKYAEKDAVWAVNQLDVNWNEQAALSAEQYLSTSSFSRDGLIQQLKFEGYTQEQAEYGVKKAGL